MLTDAVLEHILADTVAQLDLLTGSSAPQPVALSVPESPAEYSLAHQAVDDAELELGQLEEALAHRYSDSSKEDKPWLISRSIASSAAGPSMDPARSRNTGQVVGPGSSRILRSVVQLSLIVQQPDKLQPAALPLERVQRIERYRTRFAHHCLAAREAGIERGGSDDAASTATWEIWPYLADSIAMAAVAGAIEECHAAMERHVDEMVRHEIGACCSGP